jgi:ABC-type Fe3+ transport system permease subunit
MKGSEIIGFVVLILLIIGLPSLFGYISSINTASDNQDTDLAVESTEDFFVDYSISSVAGAIIIAVASVAVGILVTLGLVKKG